MGNGSVKSGVGSSAMVLGWFGFVLLVIVTVGLLVMILSISLIRKLTDEEWSNWFILNAEARNTCSLRLCFSFRDLLTPTSSSPTTYLTLIMGRHKWEMNNTYEHTTLAQFTEWMGTEHTILGTFWFPHGEFGIWTIDFYEHIWGYGSSHAFSSCDLIRAIFVDSSPRNSYLATLPICQDRMNAMPSSHILYRSIFAGVFFLFWVDFCFMFSTWRLFDLVMYTTASCLFPRCVRFCFSRRTANPS